ncbi:MAG: glycosyltransferase [Anaerolineae bacterium]|nr:glycosyltransferase [Phycisphaerae bacterium]
MANDPDRSARRILLLITDLEIGGTPTVVRELAIRLGEPGTVDIEVACLASSGPVVDQLRAAGVHVTTLGADSTLEVIGATSRLINLIRQRQYDTVLSFLVHANTIAAIASRFCRRVRFIQSIQTTQPRPRWHWLMQTLASHAAERIIVPTESTARVASDRAHVPARKIVVIPNAIDPAAFERSRVPLESPRPFPVGFIGRLDAVKRVPHLVQQLHAMRQTFPGTPVHLHIFGEGDQRWRIEAEIDRLHLKRDVTMHGAVDSPQIALKQIGVLVLPSVAEGFGLVLIEAMAAGVPVVATNVPGIRDVVRHEQTGLLVDPNDTMGLAFAVMRVIEDAPLRISLIDAGVREVHERFSWPPVLALYRDVLRL